MQSFFNLSLHFAGLQMLSDEFSTQALLSHSMTLNANIKEQNTFSHYKDVITID